jgi:hypothetical protein
MRKWLVLAVGALLALSGLLFIWQGADIIQIERGWASVIAGSVALAGGVVTMAIGALIGTVERLQASLAQQGGVEVPQPAEPAVVPTPAPQPVPAPQPEPIHQPEPAPIPAPEPEAPKPAPLPEPEEPKMPAAPVLPPLAQPVRLPEPLTPVPASPPAAPVVAAAATAVAGAGLFGFFSRRRKAAEPSRDEPGDEQEAPRLPDFLVRRDIVGEAPRVELQEPLQETDAAPDVQPHGSRESDESEQASPSPDSYAWLDRALAGDDKPEPAFDWLRNRAPEPNEKEPILEDEASEPQTEEPFEQAYLAQEPEVESEPHEAAPDAEPAHEAEPAPAQVELPPQAPPTVVGRYSSGGSDYTLYSDGSIDAESPEGHQHFASMVELRAHIEAQTDG